MLVKVVINCFTYFMRGKGETKKSLNKRISRLASSGSRNKSLFMILAAIVLVFIVAFLLIQHNKSNSAQKNQSAFEKNHLLTYINNDNYKNLLITNPQRKSLATLPMQPGDNTLEILTNNVQGVIVHESNVQTSGSSSQISNHKYYLISLKGKITQLSPVVATFLNSSVSGAFLGNNNNYYEVICNHQQCGLNVLNLNTNKNTVIMANQIPPPSQTATTSSTSMDLVGISPNNIAYLIMYPQGAQQKAIFSEYNISTKKIIKSFVLPDLGISANLPDLAYDYNHLIYTDNTNAHVSDLVDLNTGKTTQIIRKVTGNNSVISGYIWSPDSQKVAFQDIEATSSKGLQSAVIGYIPINKPQAIILKNFGDFNFNEVHINGWSSSSDLNYTYWKTPSANDISKSLAYDYSVNMPSGKITTSPPPKGYTLIN